MTGLSRPTVHRLLKTLVAEGVVEQNARTRRYSVGEQIPLLALARPKRSALLTVADPLVARVAREVGDTVFLTIQTGDDTLCMARFMGGYSNPGSRDRSRGTSSPRRFERGSRYSLAHAA